MKGNCQVDLIQCVKTTTLNWTEQNDHGYGYGKVLAECVLDRGKRKSKRPPTSQFAYDARAGTVDGCHLRKDEAVAEQRLDCSSKVLLYKLVSQRKGKRNAKKR